MKKSTFFKTLLLAAGLLGGGSAWADDVYTTVYQRNVTYGDANIWTSADLTAWGDNASLSINVPTDDTSGTYYGLKGSADAAYSGSITLSTTSNAKVKYELTVYTSRTYYNNNLHFIQFGDKVRVSWVCVSGGSSESIYVSTDGTSSLSNTLLASDQTPGKHTVSIIFNTALNTVESFSVDATDYSNKLAGVIASPGNLSKITMGYDRGHKAYESDWGLSQIIVSQCPQTVTEKDYTINYTYDEETIASESGTSTVGATVLATQTSMWNDGNTTKYFVADNAMTSFEITSDGTNVFEVALRLAETINYTVQAVDGEGNALAIDNLASGSVIEGETQIAYWNKYVKVDNQWYETSSPYGKNITSAINPVTYTPSAITYFVEGESMNGYNAASSNSGTGYSGGVIGRPRANSNWYTDAVDVSGLYTVNFPYALIANSSASTLSGLYVRASDSSTTLIEESVSLSSNTTYTKENVAIPAGSSFQISKGSANSNYGIDYVTLTLTAITAPITSATGYATFSSKYALDFTDVTALTAYTATACDGETVTLTKVTGTVAANTGLVIKGETANIPVVATGDAQAGNLLFALDGSYSTLNAAASGTNYVLSVQDDKAVFAPIGATGAPVTAGHAALFVPEAGGGAKLRLVFADELANGINGVTAVSNADAAIYNLSGQRVNAAYKGIVIKNGKKYLNK